jgi:hypothetical protein
MIPDLSISVVEPQIALGGEAVLEDVDRARVGSKRIAACRPMTPGAWSVSTPGAGRTLPCCC